MATRIEQEKKTVEMMTRMYCSHFEGNKDLCPQCAEVLEYSLRRLEHCKFGNSKPTCRKCTVHCYRPDYREKIREIMRWSGPRMILYHPVAAIRHLFREML